MGWYRYGSSPHIQSTNAVWPCALTTPHAPLTKTCNPCPVSDLFNEDQTVKGRVHYQMILHNSDASSSLAVFLINPLICKWGFLFFLNTSKTQPVILKEPAEHFTCRLIKATGKLLPADFLQISPVIPHELWHYCLTTQPQINPQPHSDAAPASLQRCVFLSFSIEQSQCYTRIVPH